MNHNDANEEESPSTTSTADKESGNSTAVDDAVSGPWSAEKQEVTVEEESLSDSDDDMPDDGGLSSSSPINRPSTPQEGDFGPGTDRAIAEHLVELRAISPPSSDFYSEKQKYRKARLQELFGKYTTWEAYPGFTEDMKGEWRELLVELVTYHHEKLMPNVKRFLERHAVDWGKMCLSKRHPGLVDPRVLRKRKDWFDEAGKPLPEWVYKV